MNLQEQNQCLKHENAFFEKGKYLYFILLISNNIIYENVASDSVTDSLVLSKSANAQNHSCLGLCGRDICPKSSASFGPGTFNAELLVFI